MNTDKLTEEANPIDKVKLYEETLLQIREELKYGLATSHYKISNLIDVAISSKITEVLPTSPLPKETDAVEFAEWASDNQWYYSKDFNHWVKMEQFRPAVKSSTELHNLFLNKK